MDTDLVPEDLLIYREAQEGSNATSNRWISIDLDTNLTQELINEGLAREVVNRIQRSRKDLNFNVEDRIQLVVQTEDTIKDIIESFADYIKSETLTTDIQFSNVDLNETNTLEHEIEKEKLTIKLSK
jgi:isoleucyl-tRNA synthetase